MRTSVFEEYNDDRLDTSATPSTSSNIYKMARQIGVSHHRPNIAPSYDLYWRVAGIDGRN